MERVIVLVIFLILIAIFGGMLGRLFQRPDIAELIGNSVMGGIGVLIVVILICYGIGTLRLRRLLKERSKDESANTD